MTVPKHLVAPQTHAAILANGQPHVSVLCASFRPTIELISILRKLAYEFTKNALDDDDVSSRVALAIHELLENSVKYSSDGFAALSIDMNRSSEVEIEVTIRVTNRVDVERMPALKEALRELGDAQDPDVYYTALMRRTAARESGSGLGLARILAEGEMKLRGEIEGDTVCIVADMRVRPGT